METTDTHGLGGGRRPSRSHDIAHGGRGSEVPSGLVAKSDGGISPDEMTRMVELLREQFRLQPEEALNMITRAADEASDQSFPKILKKLTERDVDFGCVPHEHQLAELEDRLYGNRWGQNGAECRDWYSGSADVFPECREKSAQRPHVKTLFDGWAWAKRYNRLQNGASSQIQPVPEFSSANYEDVFWTRNSIGDAD